MFFFGIGTKTIVGQLIKHIQCPSCESSRLMTFAHLAYFHIFGIPMFLVRYRSGVRCSTCQQTYEGSDLPAEWRTHLSGRVPGALNAVTAFSGTIVIILAFFFMIYVGSNWQEKQIALIEQVKKDDMYVFNFTKYFGGKDRKHRYGIFRVIRVTSKGVEFRVSRKTYPKSFGMNGDIYTNRSMARSYYFNKQVLIKKPALLELRRSHVIEMVYRVDPEERARNSQ